MASTAAAPTAAAAYASGANYSLYANTVSTAVGIRVDAADVTAAKVTAADITARQHRCQW